MAPRLMPEAAFLRECFEYDPLTGILRWKVRPRGHFPSDWSWKRTNTCLAGRAVGKVRSNGYLTTQLSSAGMGRVDLRVHRVVWAMMTDDDPGPLMVDHRNRRRSDNRWANLRLATDDQNCRNTVRSRVMWIEQGVWWRKGRAKPFSASIALGDFATEMEAVAAHEEARRLLIDAPFWNP